MVVSSRVFSAVHVRRRILLAAVIAACTIALAPHARAAEHITLRNGFELDCVRHEVLAGGRVRLYLPGNNNYQEIAAAAIARIEAIADIPAASPEIKNASQKETALTSGELRQLLSHAGATHNIDEDLLASLVQAESAGQTRAVSHAGAQGLMQLMPSTARQLGVQDSFAADQNIRGGTAYLDALLTRYNDNMALALAAYNAGPAAVDRYHGIPPFRETRAYVARVIREFNRRKKLASTAALAASVAVR